MMIEKIIKKDASQLAKQERGADSHAGKKYEEAIRKFLKEYFLEKGRGYGIGEVDFSAPKMTDMALAQNGDYVIENFSVSENEDGSKNFNFYIGKTEVHLTGKAAQKINESLSS